MLHAFENKLIQFLEIDHFKFWEKTHIKIMKMDKGQWNEMSVQICNR